MSEMIENVAKAIHDEVEGVTGPNDDSGGGHYMRAARAAIAAMREPTQAMLDAAIPRYQEHNRGDDPYASEMADYWTTMIDAALGDQS